MGKYLKENPRLYSAEYAGDAAQRKYFSNLALRYLSLIKLHRESRHLPSLKNLSPEQIEANIASSGQKDWSGVVRHCLAEAGAVDALAQLLNLPEKDRDTIIQAAILHDYDKRAEIEALKVSQGEQKIAVEKIKAMSRRILLEKGIKPEIADIIDEVGDVEIVQRGGVNLLQKILFYIDNITEGTNLVAVETKHAGLVKRYPRLAAEGYYDKWVASTKKVQKELADKIGLNDPNQLPNFITQKVKQSANKPSQFNE